MLVRTYAGALQGVHARIISVEVTVGQGINFFMVGLPDSAVKESHHRIDAALRYNGYRIPGKRIIVNLAPADLRKEGTAFDLTIAIGILSASEQMNARKVHRFMIMGELSLDGSIKPLRGALPLAICARSAGLEGMLLPAANAREAAVVKGIDVYGVAHIKEVIGFFDGHHSLQKEEVDPRAAFMARMDACEYDFADVKGQESIKRAFEVAAAGGHNLLMIGPPGSGKTMLARRLPGILPPPNLREALETTKIHSVAGKLEQGSSLLAVRPFRSPHHTVSDAALAGGGSYPQPGEISLAHNGVLFLDELPEFKRSVLEVLRQPMEDRVVTVSRARFSVDYPAAFMLIASMNPCPCGFYNHPEKDCVCAPGQVQKYLNRVSGPLLDRMDIQVEVTPVPFEEMSRTSQHEKSCIIRERVVRARLLQEQRLSQTEGIYCNAQLGPRLIKQFCQPCKAGWLLLKTAMERLSLSARAYDRILKLSRTIADLAGEAQIKPEHLAEAIQYRSLDRDTWAGG